MLDFDIVSIVKHLEHQQRDLGSYVLKVETLNFVPVSVSYIVYRDISHKRTLKKLAF